MSAWKGEVPSCLGGLFGRIAFRTIHVLLKGGPGAKALAARCPDRLDHRSVWGPRWPSLSSWACWEWRWRRGSWSRPLAATVCRQSLPPPALPLACGPCRRMCDALLQGIDGSALAMKLAAVIWHIQLAE